MAAKLGKDEINLLELGYKRVISNGTITRPLKIKVLYVTERAKQKIKAAGGSVEIVEK